MKEEMGMEKDEEIEEGRGLLAREKNGNEMVKVEVTFQVECAGLTELGEKSGNILGMMKQLLVRKQSI